MAGMGGGVGGILSTDARWRIVTFLGTHTHKPCARRGHKRTKPVEWSLTLMAPSSGGATFNCLVIVSMLSVSQSIKPH